MSDFLKATSMDHVNMNVKNLEQSVKFYKDLFGFEVRKEDNSPNKLDAPSKNIGNDSIKLCFYGGPVEFEKSQSVYIKDPSGYDIELSKILGGGL